MFLTSPRITIACPMSARLDLRMASFCLDASSEGTRVLFSVCPLAVPSLSFRDTTVTAVTNVNVHVRLQRRTRLQEAERAPYWRLGNIDQKGRTVSK